VEEEGGQPHSNDKQEENAKHLQGAGERVKFTVSKTLFRKMASKSSGPWEKEGGADCLVQSKKRIHRDYNTGKRFAREK